MLNIIDSPLESGQRYTWPPMFTEVALPDHPWHALLISSSVGSLDELAGSTASLDAGWTVSLEDSGAIVELVGWTDSELVGSMASELAGSAVELAGTAAELLDSSADEMASMSELLTGSWLRGMSPSVWLELLVVSGELTESGTESTTSPEVGELSSQAINVKDAVMPIVAAMALLTFFFSIFTNTSTLCTKIYFFGGKRL